MLIKAQTYKFYVVENHFPKDTEKLEQNMSKAVNENTQHTNQSLIYDNI